MRTLLPAIIALTLFSACIRDNNNTAPDNEEELITTVLVQISDTVGNQVTLDTAAFRDIDGPGGTLAVVDTIVLAANSRARVQLRLLDESQSPAQDITPEIEAEKNVHQFFYNSSGLELFINYDTTDYDSNVPRKPLGLKTYWFPEAPGTGQLRIVLKHQPGIKPGINNSAGDQSLGETDVDATFPVRIE